jgi:hypothetical protein
MKLSENFTLDELTKSQTAARRGINNSPHHAQVAELERLCTAILQPLRDHYDRPVRVTSGYRCAELCIAIGSKHTSQHAKGQAADFEVPGVSNMEVATWISDNLEFDQLILECYTGGNTGWIHCSISDDCRGELLTYDRTNGYRKGLIDGS